MNVEGHDEEIPEQSVDTRTRHGKRRYRAHAVLLLLIILGITVITLRSENVVSTKLRSTSFKQVSLDDALQTISPFAKKKVTPHKRNINV
jgi:hypothetical protein